MAASTNKKYFQEIFDTKSLKRVKHLVERESADVNAKNESEESWPYGGTALHYAAERGDLDIATYLITHGSNINETSKFGSTPLMTASGNGHIKVVKLLLEKGADFDACDQNGVTALSLASLNGWEEIVKLLLEKNPATINKRATDGSSALQWALMKKTEGQNYVNIINNLKGKGAM